MLRVLIGKGDEYPTHRRHQLFVTFRPRIPHRIHLIISIHHNMVETRENLKTKQRLLPLEIFLATPLVWSN